MERQVYVSSTNSYEFKIISWASFHHVITYISLCLLVQGVALRLWAVLSLADTYWQHRNCSFFFFFLIINTDSNTIKFLVYPCPKIQSGHCLPLFPFPSVTRSRCCHSVSQEASCVLLSIQRPPLYSSGGPTTGPTTTAPLRVFSLPSSASREANLMTYTLKTFNSFLLFLRPLT